MKSLHSPLLETAGMSKETDPLQSPIRRQSPVACLRAGEQPAETHRRLAVQPVQHYVAALQAGAVVGARQAASAAERKAEPGNKVLLMNPGPRNWHSVYRNIINFVFL